MKSAAAVQAKIVPAGEFKAKCLGFIKNVSATPITITHRGKPVAQLVPMQTEEKPFVSIFGLTPGKAPSEKEWKDFKKERAKDWDEWDKNLLETAKSLQASAKKQRRSK